MRHERILREINDRNWEFARRLILCVAVASRPRVEELAEFLAFEVRPIPKFREDWRLEDPVGACLRALHCLPLSTPSTISLSNAAHLRARSCLSCSLRFHLSFEFFTPGLVDSLSTFLKPFGF